MQCWGENLDIQESIKLHSVELHTLFSSPTSVVLINSRRLDDNIKMKFKGKGCEEDGSGFTSFKLHALVLMALNLCFCY